MPKYYFHMLDGLRSVVDGVGASFASDDAAKGEAYRRLSARAVADLPDSGKDRWQARIEVTDEPGSALFNVELRFRLAQGA